MGVLEQVTNLQNQGYGEQDIIDNLQQQGISPKEITDAMNQSKIKSAVSSEPPIAGAPPTPGAPGPEATAGQGYYTPQTQPAQEAYAAPEGAEYYQENAYAPASTGMDSDTIIEIANQVFSEKIRKTEKRVEELEELKTILQVKVDGIDERLKRIEKMIDALQIQVIEKVGSYGKELSSTKKQVSMLENTLGKTIKAKAGTKKKTTSRKKK
jgi:hypothetical protein